MTYLSEDPTYLAGALSLVAGALLITLNITKQGKYLVAAGIAFGLALAVLLIEWMWVTDNERIEMVVYDVRKAVLNSDAEAVIAHLAPDVSYSQDGTSLSLYADDGPTTTIDPQPGEPLPPRITPVSVSFRRVLASNPGGGKQSFAFSPEGACEPRRIQAMAPRRLSRAGRWVSRETRTGVCGR